VPTSSLQLVPEFVDVVGNITALKKKRSIKNIMKRKRCYIDPERLSLCRNYKISHTLLKINQETICRRVTG
jgi:hypothetical protein